MNENRENHQGEKARRESLTKIVTFLSANLAHLLPPVSYHLIVKMGLEKYIKKSLKNHQNHQNHE